MEINIRDWTVGDLSTISSAWMAFCRESARSDMTFKPDADHAMMQWLLSRFDQSTGVGFVAERDSVCAGFIVGRIDLWESVPPVIQARNLGIIDAVYVGSEFRRQGIATKLIRRALMAMRERNADAVETIYDPSNKASAATWTREGFLPWMVHANRML